MRVRDTGSDGRGGPRTSSLSACGLTKFLFASKYSYTSPTRVGRSGEIENNNRASSHLLDDEESHDSCSQASRVDQPRTISWNLQVILDSFSATTYVLLILDSWVGFE